MFVANRAEQISDHTSTTHWDFIESSSNFVDATSGLDSGIKNLINRWFNGPLFLWDKKQCSLQKCEMNEKPEKDLELKKLISVNMIKISIKQLDPLLVSHKIIRVGGRFRKPSFTEAEQHPVMLPRISVVSDGIIQWSHNSVAHGARGVTLNHLTNTGI